MPRVSARFTSHHACPQCTFIGHFAGADLWYCKQNGMPTAIARFSNDGPDYTSGPVIDVGDLEIHVKSRQGKGTTFGRHHA